MKKILPILSLLLIILSPLTAEKITFSASGMTGQAGNSNTTTTLTGNAYIKTDTMEINADEVELSGEDFRYIKAKGKVEGKNLETKMDFSCDSLEYDREKKLAVLKGSVVFKDVENDVEAEAEVIEYNQETEIVILQINVKLTQEDNICTGSYGIYYKDNQLLELSGNAKVQQKDDTFRAQHITLNLDTQEITLGGNVKGSVTDTKVILDEENEEDIKDGKEKETESTEEENNTVDENKTEDKKENTKINVEKVKDKSKKGDE